MADQNTSLQILKRDDPAVRISELTATIEATFETFGIIMDMIDVKLFSDGICFTMRPVEPVRMHVVRGFEDDLRYALGKDQVAIMAPLPDAKLIGVTVFLDVQREIYGVIETTSVPTPWSFDYEDDELYDQAKIVVLRTGNTSASYLQRKLGIGYSRALKLLGMLEERGIIGPSDGNGSREIYPE